MQIWHLKKKGSAEIKIITENMSDFFFHMIYIYIYVCVCVCVCVCVSFIFGKGKNMKTCNWLGDEIFQRVIKLYFVNFNEINNHIQQKKKFSKKL